LALWDIGRTDEAIAEIKEVVVLRPDFAKVIKNDIQFQKFQNNKQFQKLFDNK
jgi:hypothetical protein